MIQDAGNEDRWELMTRRPLVSPQQICLQKTKKKQRLFSTDPI